MLYIKPQERESIGKFRAYMYEYIKINKLRYSDQRERVLKILYTQSHPVSIDFIVKKLKGENLGASYATVARHLKFFDKLDMLIVVKKSQKGYLLKKSVDNINIEVISHDINQE